MLFDTRYFWATVTSKDTDEKAKLKALATSGPAYVSSVTIYEFHKTSLIEGGRDVANLRTARLEREFNTVVVDGEIAKEGAEISHKIRVPMADALIMATARRLRLPIVTDDPHFTEVKTVWV